jgi:hypothetical protein
LALLLGLAAFHFAALMLNGYLGICAAFGGASPTALRIFDATAAILCWPTFDSKIFPIWACWFGRSFIWALLLLCCFHAARALFTSKQKNA